MNIQHQQRLVRRFERAWSGQLLYPVAVHDGPDSRSWSVVFVHRETGEVSERMVQKRELRQQERARLAAIVPPEQKIASEIQARCLPRAVACGLDTMYLNVRHCTADYEPLKEELSSELQAALDELKFQAQHNEIEHCMATCWQFGGELLVMKDKGGSHFKWIVENDAITLAIGRGKITGVIAQVRLSSTYLWGWNGRWQEMVIELYAFLEEIFGRVLVEVSSLDLAVDLIGVHPFFSDAASVKERFISRASVDDERPSMTEDGMSDGPDNVKRRWKRVTGLPFGLHKSAVSAILYNKSFEIQYQSPKKVWMWDIWEANAQGWHEVPLDRSEQVWRVELRFKRPALNQFGLEEGLTGIEKVFTVLDRLPDLWAYGVGHVGGDTDGLPDGWLRYVLPSEDSNRSRWPVHPAWEVVQNAFLASMQREVVSLQASDEKVPGGDAAAERVDVLEPAVLKPLIRRRIREVNLDRGVKTINGWASTVESWRWLDGDKDEIPEVFDIGETFTYLYGEVVKCLEENKRDFSEEVQRKRVLYRKDAQAA